MDRTVGVFKSGWHPQRKEGRSIRGEVTGLVGRGKKQAPSSANPRSPDHVARPLATLTDPEAFGPPPKNLNYHGSDSKGPAAPPRRQAPTRQIPTRESQTRQPEEGWRAEEALVPYRSNTTGLSTAGLLPPPRPMETLRDPDAVPSSKPKPQLPPRLPPRQNTQPAASITSPPPPYTETTSPSHATNDLPNQGAVNRLAMSGVTVPGFGIGKASPSENPQSPVQSTQRFAPPSISGLRGQFSSLSTSNPSPPPQTASAPSVGTTWAQKQAALSTASQFHKDPSKVSAGDARAAFSTANNFRQRHGDEVAKGLSVGQEMNKKYGVVNKAQGFAAGSTTEQASAHDGQVAALPAVNDNVQENKWSAQTNAAASGIGFKKAPPPPPPTRRPTEPLSVSKSPPPIPMSSKPR